jgi:hypothetical protein
METKQKELEVAVSQIPREVSAMLASTAANTETLADLKGLFAKYFKNMNPSGDGSGSVSISAMETQGNIQTRSVEPGTGRVHEISLSHDSEILMDSAFEGDRAIEEAPPKSRE